MIISKKLDKEIKISFVGDIIASDTDYTSGFGTGSKFLKYADKIQYTEKLDYFKESDITFANLEAPLINHKKINLAPFCGSYKFASFLKNVNISIVSIANNHILEQSKEGFLSTIEILKESNIAYTGINENSLSNIEIIKKGDICFGFASYCSKHIQDLENPNIFAEINEEKIIESINVMKGRNADIIIISLHWGDEYVNIPSKSQINLAHKLIDAGANIIAGHHPHIIQNISVTCSFQSK